MGLKALIFDVDGTLAETEEAHRTAFNRAFAEAGLDWHWTVSDYRYLLGTTGGRERIDHFITWQGLELQNRHERIAALHRTKNSIYAEIVAGGAVKLRPGVEALIEDALATGLQIAIATTTSRSNLEALVKATPLARFPFAAIITGEDVTRKKPDPQAYVIALRRLGLSADECLAFEDSANGLNAALGAGLKTVVTPGIYTIGDDFTGATCIVDLPSYRFPWKPD
ncbi:MAG: HAD-IA family hydrolase [Sphingomonadaceae bacterium]